MKKKVEIPYDFMINELFELEPEIKRMFGAFSIYFGDKIYFALRKSEKNKADNGIWIGTELKYHQKLKQLFSSIRNFKEIRIKKWLVLPEDSDDFEEVGMKLCEMVKEGHPAIGVLPKKKKK